MPAKEFKPRPLKPAVGLEALEGLDIRVGRILRVESLTNADRLVRLVVDFGDHERTIVAGIKREREDPREVEGKQALFVVNLEPRRIRGELSEGMLFDVGFADGILPALLVPEREVPNGAQAG